MYINSFKLPHYKFLEDQKNKILTVEASWAVKNIYHEVRVVIINGEPEIKDLYFQLPSGVRTKIEREYISRFKGIIT